MNSAVRIELLKLRTTPAAWVTLLVVGGLTAMSAVATILLAGHKTAALGSPSNVSHAVSVGATTSVALLILGIVISAGEDRHRTILSTYLAEPHRGRVVVAKLVTGAGVGAALAAFAYALALAIAIPLYAAKGVHHLPVPILTLGAGAIVGAACFGLLGVALGALTRNTTTSIVGALVWVGVVELVLLQPFTGLEKWLPVAASRALTDAGQGDVGLLHPAVAATVLVLWALAVSMVACRITVRREVR
jgi:ABC-2 type transport system permease protein